MLVSGVLNLGRADEIWVLIQALAPIHYARHEFAALSANHASIIQCQCDSLSRKASGTCLTNPCRPRWLRSESRFQAEPYLLCPVCRPRKLAMASAPLTLGFMGGSGVTCHTSPSRNLIVTTLPGPVETFSAALSQVPPEFHRRACLSIFIS